MQESWIRSKRALQAPCNRMEEGIDTTWDPPENIYILNSYPAGALLDKGRTMIV